VEEERKPFVSRAQANPLAPFLRSSCTRLRGVRQDDVSARLVAVERVMNAAVPRIVARAENQGEFRRAYSSGMTRAAPPRDSSEFLRSVPPVPPVQVFYADVSPRGR